jgi:hypothetical protein
MSLDINVYGQFSGGNSLVATGTGICGEPRLYPKNAYYRFNKLRDEGDWPSHLSGIYYGKGDCINCPKSNLKNFKDYSWKENFAGTNSEKLEQSEITDINQFLMLNSKVGVADIHYKFLGPAFQRLVVGYQVFWPMQGFQNPTQHFTTSRVYVVNSQTNSNGNISSSNAANRPGVGEWAKEYDGTTLQPWGQMQRKIVGDYRIPDENSNLNMGAWQWQEQNFNYFQWYINSNFNGPPKISGFENGLNKKFSELRIIFDSCSVSNIENRVRVPCPTPGSHIFPGKSLLAGQGLKYRFHPSDEDNRGIVGCFIEYFALIFTDKEKDTLDVVQLGIVAARSGYNFYDVDGSSTFDDLLQQYGLSIQGGQSISGEANIEITGFGLPRELNINLCSNTYFNYNLDRYFNLFTDARRSGGEPDLDRFSPMYCEQGDSIYLSNFDKFSGINVASGLHRYNNDKEGLWTSGHYLDPPFYNGGFLSYGDASYMGIQDKFFGAVTRTTWPGGKGPYGEDENVGDFDPNFYPGSVVGEGKSSYSFSQAVMGNTGWFCRQEPSTIPGGFIRSYGYIPSKWLYLSNEGPRVLNPQQLDEDGELAPAFITLPLIPINPLYFFHGHAGALLTPYDHELDGGGYVCGGGSHPFLNKISPCNFYGNPEESLDTESYTSNNTIFKSLLNTPQFGDAETLGSISVAGSLENPSA